MWITISPTTLRLAFLTFAPFVPYAIHSKEYSRQCGEQACRYQKCGGSFRLTCKSQRCAYCDKPCAEPNESFYPLILKLASSTAGVKEMICLIQGVAS